MNDRAPPPRGRPALPAAGGRPARTTRVGGRAGAAPPTTSDGRRGRDRAGTPRGRRHPLRAVRRVRARRAGRAQPALRLRAVGAGRADEGRPSRPCAPTAPTPGCGSTPARSTRGPRPRYRSSCGRRATSPCSTTSTAIGPAGRRMMRQTALTQVCLDWWPGRAGLEQWRVLLLAGPFLAAAFARSAGPTSRLATWLAVDPDRTGVRRPAAARRRPGGGVRRLRARRRRRSSTRTRQHLSTLFPPVPPAGPLPRGAVPRTCSPTTSVGPLAEVLAELLYDDERAPPGAAPRWRPSDPRLAEHWDDAAHG